MSVTNKRSKALDNKVRLKRDIILVLSMVIIAAAAFLIINFAVKKDGSYAVIKVDGNVIKTLDLNSGETTIEVNGYQGGVNKVVINDGKVHTVNFSSYGSNRTNQFFGVPCTGDYGELADWCANMISGYSRVGETIVCLPHRVVVEIKGSQDDDSIDSVVR